MALFESSDRRFAESFSRLVTSNPFLPEWVGRERELLGSDYREAPRVYAWHPGWTPDSAHANLGEVGDRVDRLVDRARQRLAEGRAAAEKERVLYADLALYRLYRHHALPLDGLIAEPGPGKPPAAAAVWEAFRKDFEGLFGPTGQAFPSGHEPAHVFACFFQLRRAVYHIFHNIVGLSAPAARLRGAVWQSIVTHDMKRWARSLCHGMRDFPTLITGPSGTGKDLVAQAVGRSLHVPFDPRKGRFVADFASSFHALNVSALAPALVESELFGHAAGSFTGAVADRKGWLEKCGPHGAVFLDEIGELDPGIQVKLLRVLQSRCFQPVGLTEEREFAGKIIAATNRDLAAEMRAGRFREDLYYRLCADRVTTPSLREQFADRPEDLPAMVEFIVRRVAGPKESAALTAEVVAWIDARLGRGYGWPGNFRELEQCVRSYAIRKEYVPLAPVRSADARRGLAEAVAAGSLTADELERRYFTLVYAGAGNLQEAARRLGRDWRTLRAKLDRDFLRELSM